MFKFTKTLFFILLTLSSTSTASMAIQPKCLVCLEEDCASSFFRLSCGHQYCLDCIFNVIKYSIEDHEYPKCPNPGCRQSIDQQDIARLGVDSSIIKRLEYLEIAKHPASKFCPTYSCPYAFINEDVEVKIIQCPECHQTYCCQCLRMHNPRISCRKAERVAEAQEEQKYKEAETASKDWIAQNSRQCAKCGTPLLKKGGCNAVTCTKCGTKVKWNPEKKHH
ncbi:MAG: IBR domain-containing protein [bacterium]